MFRPMLIVLLISSTTPVSTYAQSACADPVPSDSAWWRWRQVRETDNDLEMEAPLAPSQPDSFRLAMLRGTFALQLTPTVGPDRGVSIHALIRIETDTTGTARASAEWPTYFSLAPDSTSAGQTQPLNVLFDASARRLTFVIVNPGLRWTDSGVFLDVFEVEDARIIGRWVDGGLSVYRGAAGDHGLHPQGWFCMTRVGD